MLSALGSGEGWVREGFLQVTGKYAQQYPGGGPEAADSGNFLSIAQKTHFSKESRADFFIFSIYSRAAWQIILLWWPQGSRKAQFLV